MRTDDTETGVSGMMSEDDALLLLWWCLCGDVCFFFAGDGEGERNENDEDDCEAGVFVLVSAVCGAVCVWLSVGVMICASAMRSFMLGVGSAESAAMNEGRIFCTGACGTNEGGGGHTADSGSGDERRG